MRQEFSHEYMKENCGCYSEEDLMNCSFMNNDPVTLSSILDSEISLSDKYWFVCKKLATKKQNQEIAISVAEIVLVVFETKYPEDKRPRLAIQAAKDYLAGTIGLEELREKRRAAAYAAYAAAAYAYAAAAYAASDDAASAYAAYAAAAADDTAATYAAYAAAAAAALQTSLLTFLKSFCLQAIEV